MGDVLSRAVSDRSRPVCGAITSCPTCGSLHGCHGVVVSAEYTGCSWTPAVIIMQCVHDVFGLFP